MRKCKIILFAYIHILSLQQYRTYPHCAQAQRQKTHSRTKSTKTILETERYWVLSDTNFSNRNNKIIKAKYTTSIIVFDITVFFFIIKVSGTLQKNRYWHLAISSKITKWMRYCERQIGSNGKVGGYGDKGGGKGRGVVVHNPKRRCQISSPYFSRMASFIQSLSFPHIILHTFSLYIFTNFPTLNFLAFTNTKKIEEDF